MKVLKPELANRYQWFGCYTGLAGAALLAFQSAFSGWGFVFFLASNIFLISYAVVISARGLMVLQFGFTATSIIGILNSFYDNLATKFFFLLAAQASSLLAQA